MKAPLAALLLGLVGCAHRRPPMAPAPPMAAEVVVLATEDGAAVQLHHHPAAGPPVLVVHGLGSRGQYFDLNEDQSLARALQGQGFDAWLLDLRGHGGLQKGADGRHLKAGWTLDDYGRYDIHAAIQHIQASTGHAQVGYIGHSMGGMALAIYQSWHGDAALAAVVILASPVDFGDPDPLLKASGRAMLAGAALPSLHPEVFGGMAARRARLPLHAEAMLANMENLGAETWAAMVAHGTGPLSRGELLQLHQVVRSGCFCSMDGSRDYLRDLSQLSAPPLVFAGRADGIAPADRVKPFYDHAGSNHKAFEIAGRIHGYGADYGHLDLTAGRRAPAEIWPLIFAWFEGRWTDALALPATDALQGQEPAAPAPP